MKTVINTLIISAMILSISFAAGKPVFKKESNWEVIKKGENTLTLKEGYWTHRLGVNTDARNNRAVYDTISLYYTPTSVESYHDGMAGYQSTGTDSVIMRYHLLTDGIINEIHVMIHTGGPAEAWIQGPAVQWVDDDGDGIFETGWYQYPNDSEVGNPAIPSTIESITPFSVPVTFEASVLANHFTQDGDWEPWLASTGTGWQVVDFVSVFGSGIEVTATAMNSPNDEIYIWAGYTATSGNSSNPASIYQDDPPSGMHSTEEEGNCPSYSTLDSQGNPGAWYAFVSVDDDGNWITYLNHMMQVVVQYDAVPPIIEDQAQFSDTFAETKRIWADVMDLDGDAFACTLYTITSNADGSSNGTLPMTADLNTAGRYYADVSLDVGDTLSFQVYTEDATGRGNSGNVGSFVRVAEPSATQKTLLIQDGTIDSLNLYTSGTGLNSVLGGSEFSVYYIWNVSDHDGIDSSVVNHSTFKTIVKYGFAGSIMASAGQDDKGFDHFLERGGRLLYSDQDYFWSTGLAASGTFSAGDFAYDYLGLGSYVNDPDNDGDPDNGGYGDVQMTGVTGNTITNDWVSNPYIIDFESIGLLNWGDFTAAKTGGNAEKIFTGNTSYEATAVSNYDMGTDAPFKTIYFAFPIEAGSGNSWADFTNLLTDAHAWLVGTGGPSAAPTPVTPSSGSTITITDANVGTESQSFFLSAGNITDPDGDMIALRLEFSSGLEGFSVPAMEKATVNSFAVSYYDMAVFVGVGNTVTGTWTAVATDGTAEQVSASMDLTIDASGLTVLAVDAPIKAEGYSLHQNYPNPFNPQTKIQFEIANRSVVSIRIVDVLGQEVRNLGASEMNAGLHSAVWDGSNTLGEKMPTGVYFYEVTAIDPVSGAELFHDVSKMLLLK